MREGLRGIQDMDEQQYKSTYNHINPQRCVFEKAINSRICNCSKAQRFNLADREGVACTSMQGLQYCSELISMLRKNARFALQRLDVDQALAHAQEIKVQNGGLLGLQAQVERRPTEAVEDIDALVTTAKEKFGGLENLPYSQLMRRITSYQMRRRSNPKKKRDS